MARTKGALNKRTKEIRQVAMELTPKATQRLKKLLDSENESVALGAVKEVYDRAYGKATQKIGADEDSPRGGIAFVWLPSAE